MSVNKQQGIEPIPTPKGRLPVLGDAREIRPATAIEDLMRLARECGPIYEFRAPGTRTVIVSGRDIVDECCDESRFEKFVSPGLQIIRAGTGDGLFTSWTGEPNWRKAHNILLPAFGTGAIRGYLPMMADVASELVLKWSRLNPGEEIDVSSDMTRLTFDTIGLCGFGYRFRSFYRDEPHPFVAAMVGFLEEALKRALRLPVQDRLAVGAHRRFRRDISAMNELVDSVIAERRASGAGEVGDLLDRMLTGVDKESGAGLDDVNIRYQIITFLIAGHETTSGLLSFATYFLLKHPDVLSRAQEEVDQVLGVDLEAQPTAAQVLRLRYVLQVLKESLRLWPTAPAFALRALQNTTLAGRYAIERGADVTVLTPMLHRDPGVWRPDPERFDPDRFTPEAEAALPPNAYKPFGNGQRACIGRQFALLEAALVLGKILQRFDLVDHTGYELAVKETLTLKPADLRIGVQPRASRSVQVAVAADGGEAEDAARDEPVLAAATAQGGGAPLLVLYGSNLGTAEGVAREIADDGRTRGFDVTVASLDERVEALPTDGAVVIVTASYNGQPPDDALRFCAWLRGDLARDALAGVRYTVFGCGDRNWASTFQAVPKLVDECLAAAGAQRFLARGEGDASDDFDGQFRRWYGSLWGAVAATVGLAPPPATAIAGNRFEVAQLPHPLHDRFFSSIGATAMTVVANRELRGAGKDGPKRSTRYLELALPEDVTYRPGDHVAVLPRNHDAVVARVAARLGLDLETQVKIRANTRAATNLPVDQAATVGEILTNHVELQEPATRAQIGVLAGFAEATDERDRLVALFGDDEQSVARYREEVLKPRRSLVDLLALNPSCTPPFNVALELLPELRPRYYSIASSPRTSPGRCSLAVGVLEAPARSGDGTYRGVCSNYLGEQPAGATVYGFVRQPGIPFTVPEDPATPMIMVATGTGIAPFRGFLQERAAQRKQGDTGRALVFAGFRNPERDFLFGDELQAFAEQGVIDLVPAFSSVPGKPKVWVQDRLRERAGDVLGLLDRGAIVYICGDARRVGPEVRDTFTTIYREGRGAADDVARAWLADLRARGRYLEDIWAAS